MRTALPSAAAVLFAALAHTSHTAGAQGRVPVLELSGPSARSSETVGAVLGVRQLPGSKLLVNDAGRRQVRVFDSTLTRSTVVIDSAAGSVNSYGPLSAPIIAYPGDSSLFVDMSSQTLLVLNPRGEVSRVMALPRPADMFAILGTRSYADEKGRLIYRGRTPMMRVPTEPGKELGPMVQSDTAPIVRADFETRVIDTIGRVKMPSPSRSSVTTASDGKITLRQTVNPVQTVDDWALLSDGSIAFVRGHDYHVDVLSAAGVMSAAGKLAYDWRRLTDDDKQHLIDSTRAARDSMSRAAAQAAQSAGGRGGAPAAQVNGMAGIEMGMVAARSSASAGGAAPTMIPMGAGGPGGITMVTEYVPLKEIADYYPPIRSNAVSPDLDGNLWVLPTTSTDAKNGELVYDVVNNHGLLAHRVRLPVGRSLAGFGRGGVVYLTTGDRLKGFVLERYLVVGGPAVRQH